MIGSSTSTKAAASNNNALAALSALVVVVIVLIIVFTHCLKRRKGPSGSMQWQCRKATRRCKCLSKRPRSYTAYLERQLEKERNGDFSTKVGIDNTMTTMVGGPPMMANKVAPLTVVVVEQVPQQQVYYR